jgi:menaquinone-dependent protoporphyrinogen oxidase
VTDILITYGSSEGHTAKVADRIASMLTALGAHVSTYPAAEAPEDTRSFDAIIVGGSVHFGQYQREVINFVERHRRQLDLVPSAFFSVSLTSAAGTDAAVHQVDTYIQDLTDTTKWEPALVGQFGGAAAYSQYGFVKRLMFHSFAKEMHLDANADHDHDFTDWDAVDRFGQEFSRRVPSLMDRRTSVAA